MPPVADIASPDRMRRLGLVWFVTPLLLVGVWLLTNSHHDRPRHLAPTGVAAER